MVRSCTEEEKKKKKKTLILLLDLVTNIKASGFVCPTGISHLRLGQSGNCSGHQGQTLTGTALVAIIRTTYWWGRAYSKGSDFGKREQKVSREGAVATSSVRSF